MVEPAAYGSQSSNSVQFYSPTVLEHLANISTHGIGICPCVVVTYWLITLSTTTLHLVSAIIYGIGLVALFTVSTIFHTASLLTNQRWIINFFQVCDRVVIHYFIAASYTPWLLLKEVGWWGSQSLWIIWVLGFTGVLYQCFCQAPAEEMETTFYVICGVCPAYCLADMPDPSGYVELLAGGAAYFAGFLFFKLDGTVPFAHAIWHCFVILGCAIHVYAVFVYLYL